MSEERVDQALPGLLEIDEESPEQGLAQLVLSLVKLLHELMEKQAIRRMDAGRLSNDEVERLGRTLMRQAEAIEGLRQEFGLTNEDLDLLLDLTDLVNTSPTN